MKLLAMVILLAMPSVLLAADEMDLYIGVYTSTNGSKGIYRARLNAETGVISNPHLTIEAHSPSFLALHPNGKLLYAIHEGPKGTASAYAIDAPEKLRLLNTESSQGSGPCHLSIDGTGKYLLVAHYGGGVACLPIKPDGSLAPASSVQFNVGRGPRPEQDASHSHAIYPDAHNRIAYVCDLGTDQVLLYRFDAAIGSLEPMAFSVKLAPGSGPRHLALHPSGRLVFVNNEFGNNVTVFQRDTSQGTLLDLQTISTLPAGESSANRSTAEIFCHPNGKWLYVSNRGHDSLAGFEIEPDGKLTTIEIQSAEVAVPRGFAIDPSGRWLVVAGQNSHDLTAHAIDQATGKLGAGRNKVSVNAPVCVVFGKP